MDSTHSLGTSPLEEVRGKGIERESIEDGSLFLFGGLSIISKRFYGMNNANNQLPSYYLIK
jgi:hypothetical protein